MSHCQQSICEIPVALQTLATHGASQAQGAKKSGTATKQQGRFLSLTGQCDLPPRTASPERMEESSRSSRSDCAAPGGDGPADGQMCVTILQGWGAREVAL